MTKIGNVLVDSNSSVKVMGIINVSPESFYKDSIKVTELEISKTAEKMQNEGANIIDIGAMSTAPYLDTMISIEEEIRRIKLAIKAVKDSCQLPISVDTPRSITAKSALSCGIDAINDISQRLIGLIIDYQQYNYNNNCRSYPN